MILESILKRRSIRSYKKDDVPQELIEELIKSAQFAPNSHHNRSWEFIVIRDPKIKEILYQLLEQGYLKQAPVLIMILVNTLKTRNPIQDISVASENLMIQATYLGLGTVWKNIPEDKASEVKELLEIPDNFTCINIIPVGYIKTPRRPHADKDFDPKKIYLEKF